jgi:integrase
VGPALSRAALGGDRRPGQEDGHEGEERPPQKGALEEAKNVTAKSSQRRRPRGSAWYWKQTDCWYHTPKGTKRREPLLDGDGQRIRGLKNKEAARLALARVRVRQGETAQAEPSETPKAGTWTVVRVCSEYLTHTERAVAAGRLHPEYGKACVYYLNEFSRYCGAIAVAELRRGDVRDWIESRPSWRSPATRRNVITIILGALNYAQTEHGVRNPLKGLKKPPHRPRLNSISPEDERRMYGATDEAFGEFLFAALNTGLRPFCELAKLKAEHVEESPRGMLWRVYSSKTKKTRKIPVRHDVAKRVRRLIRTAPVGSGLPIYRNPQAREWKKATGVDRFLKLKRKLKWDQDEVRKKYSSYACRHTFAHRMLSGYWNGGVGCSIEVLAELLGDTPKTAFDHYGKEWGQHYQDPLWAAFGFET